MVTPMPMLIDVVVANTFTVVKKGSHGVLEGGCHLRILDEVFAGPQLEPVVYRLQPHVVLVDDRLPGIDVYAAIPQILRRASETRFVVYVDRDTPGQRERCLASGIHGMLVKVPSFTDTIHAVCQVARGGTFFPRGGAGESMVAPAESQGLSGREMEVLRQIATGKKSREIADHLSISLNTVKTHKKRIFVKLGVTTEAQLVKVALGYEGSIRPGTPQAPTGYLP